MNESLRHAVIPDWLSRLMSVFILLSLAGGSLFHLVNPVESVRPDAWRIAAGIVIAALGGLVLVAILAYQRMTDLRQHLTMLERENHALSAALVDASCDDHNVFRSK